MKNLTRNTQDNVHIFEMAMTKCDACDVIPYEVAEFPLENNKYMPAGKRSLGADSETGKNVQYGLGPRRVKPLFSRTHIATE